MAQSEDPSGSSTPRAFTNQTASTEDLLKSQTVGLVQLDDFRKRRAEVLEQREKEAQDRSYSKFKSSISGQLEQEGASTTAGEPGDQPPPRKRKKKTPRGLLSFGDQDDEGEETSDASSPAVGLQHTAGAHSPAPTSGKSEETASARRFIPNPNSLIPAPKVVTKATLQAEASTRDKLRKQFMTLQESVRNTEILIPFVFYDGTNIPGGVVKIKKGESIWLFLERCRKVGAALGVVGRGSGRGRGRARMSTRSKNDSRREWARVGVDDLLCVRGEVIVPHRFEFYHFIANRVPSSAQSKDLLFDYSNAAPRTPAPSSATDPHIRTPADIEDLEGGDMDPSLTKVVDRRWYERNKHIFPASQWKEFEAGKDFEDKLAQSRRDAQGNAFFFS